MMKIISKIIQAIDRRAQISLLKNHPNVHLTYTPKIGVGDQFILYPDLKKVKIENGFTIRNYVHIIVGNNASLQIGANVFMNNFCSANCLDHIEIGENTLFGENVKIYDHNHHYERTEDRLNVSHSEFTKAPVKIGKNCWLGSNVTVLKGVTIGDNCIIGAGCTIMKDIPENSTVVNQQELIFK